MSITLHAELEQLTKLGEVSDPKDAACDPFSGSPDPFRLDPADFYTGGEVANALLESTPQDGSELMDFGKAEQENQMSYFDNNYDNDIDRYEQSQMDAESEPDLCEVDKAESTIPTDSECECGGTYDEDDRCSDCSNGHDDCELQECFSCFERAQDRAERMAEGDER